MKNIILTIAFLLFPFCLAESEQMPYLPQDGALNVQYIEENNDLINVSTMKKAKKIEQAKQEANKNQNPKLKLDARQINHQRALDYTTRQNNSLLPLF